MAREFGNFIFNIVVFLAIITPVLAEDPPLKQELMEQYCTSEDAITKYTVLGYLQGYDAIEKRTYGFIIFQKKMITKDDYEIGIRSNVFEGTAMLGQEARAMARQAYNEDKNFFTITGMPLSPEENDVRRTEYRFYQKNGELESIEVFLLTRNKKGKPNKPETIKVPWPELATPSDVPQEQSAPPFVKIGLIKKYCSSTDTSISYAQLGYVDAYDNILNQYYAFIVFKEIQRDMITVGIMSNIAAGITLTRERGEKLAAQAHQEGMSFTTVGSPLASPTEGDPRSIQYRILQKNGQPEAIEIYIVTRDDAGKPKSPKSLSIKWPFPLSKKTSKPNK